MVKGAMNRTTSIPTQSPDCLTGGQRAVDAPASIVVVVQTIRQPSQQQPTSNKQNQRGLQMGITPAVIALDEKILAISSDLDCSLIVLVNKCKVDRAAAMSVAKPIQKRSQFPLREAQRKPPAAQTCSGGAWVASPAECEGMFGHSSRLCGQQAP